MSFDDDARFRNEHTLAGRTAVVTGVSRHRGIGFAIASRLLARGASVFVQHWAPHDAAQPYGADSLDDVLAALRTHLPTGADEGAGARLDHLELDLAPASNPARLIAAARESLGPIDILVCNQALSGSDGRLADLTPEMFDAHWQTNARASLLMTQAFAAQHDDERPGGRVVWITSGQQTGPMSGEIAYATSKAALAGITVSVANDLIDRGIVLNTINPGPVNTGYLDASLAPEAHDEVLRHFPRDRMGEPDDPARLIEWLVSDAGRWVVGQVISSEGGFRRWV
ncbi:SDR family oxidoreductase [Frondihabitans australicus]|uniref:3-oxoacyl-[acyl-carrier protein] reductase n=1 Tax=Frondihabitans australicus TaxID=386892 RepID=A0A495ILF5_9MICO|nr:SDR family oxidoreductase [Frondihabitans australicus]RKR75965.1 3-oxoacyl-[acyl-carrier protein] reductase [Frondihabitans australicus]